MRTHHADGFSLIEAVVATGIFVAGVAGLLQLVTLAMASDLRARRHTEAAMLAAQKVEELLSLRWGQEIGASDAKNGFGRVWTIAPLATAPDSALVIDVRVTRAGAEQSRLLMVKIRRSP